MPLTIDLRFLPGPPDGEGEWVTLAELVPIAKRPAALYRLLWARRREVARILVDDLPPTGVQGCALLLAGTSRARRLELVTPAGTRRVRPASFLARASAVAAVAVPRELIGSLRVLRRAHRILARRDPLPRRPVGLRSVAYLRPAPTLRYLGEYVGGAAAHTSGVLNGLARNGLDVDVYAPERPGRIDAAHFHEVPLGRGFHLAHWLTATAYSQDLAAAARGRRADFVYQRYTLGSLAGLELARDLGVPLVIEYNGSEVWTIANWGSGRLPLKETLVEIEERNVQDASLVVVVSDVLKEELLERGMDARRILVNPNGVDVERVAAVRTDDPAERRAALGLPDAPTVGFVGTFGPWHGVKLLPDLIEIVARELPDTRWILIGDGQLHPEVRSEIEGRGLASRALLTGVVPHERALELLAASEVCVSPHVHTPDGTRFFGSPTKLFEYMGLGKPIVAADLEQIGEVLEHERTALLHEPGDVEAAAAGVVRLLGDVELRRRLGAAALAEAEDTYSWDAHVRRILDALGTEAVLPVASS